MRITKTLFISAVLLMSATGLQAAGFIQKGNYLTVQLKEIMGQVRFAYRL